MKIFVTNLNFNTTSDNLYEVFEGYGAVDSATVITDRETGQSKGMAFVEMPDDGEAMNAIDALDNSDFDGNTIVVKKSEERESRRDNHGYGGGSDHGGGGGHWPRN